MPPPDVSLLDLEDLLAHKGFQWFLGRANREWGSDAVMQRIEALQNRLDLDDLTRKDQVNQIIVARKAVLLMLTEIDREISRRREAARERIAEEGDESRRGDTL